MLALGDGPFSRVSCATSRGPLQGCRPPGAVLEGRATHAFTAFKTRRKGWQKPLAAGVAT